MGLAVALGVLALCVVTTGLILALRNRAASLARTVRTPRDFGVLVLIERFDLSAREKSKTKLARNAPGYSQQSPKTPAQSPVPENVPSLSEIPESVSESKDPHAALEAAVQGAWFGMAPLENLLEIDEHMYTAMERLSGEQLDSIGDLSRSLSSWESAEVGSMLPDGAINKLMGHLAEPVVGEHLRDLGMQVEMPDLSNQPGYDLILNGEHAVNVKTVADYGSLSEHFAKYPDIPVVVPPDMTDIPENAIYLLDSSESVEQLDQAVELGDEKIVLVDNLLTHANLLDSAEGASDALLGNVDPFGIPFITVALSGYREIRLLVQEQTSIGPACKNLLLDIAGTGLGAGAGVATGAGVGSLLIPGIGTVLGGIVGGISGAIAGRFGTNAIKNRRLREAIESYQTACKDANKKVAQQQKEAQSRYKSEVEEQTERLADTAAECKRDLTKSCNELKQLRRTQYRLEYAQARKLLEAMLSALEAHKRRVGFILSFPSWILKILPQDSERLLQQQFQQHHRLIEQLESEAKIMLRHSQPLEGKEAVAFLQLLLTTDVVTDNIRVIISLAEDGRRTNESQWRRTIEEARKKIADQRHQCFIDLVDRIEKLQKETEKLLETIREGLKWHGDQIRMEGVKLGRKM